jgi:hypothetical protein
MDIKTKFNVGDVVYTVKSFHRYSDKLCTTRVIGPTAVTSISIYVSVDGDVIVSYALYAQTSRSDEYRVFAHYDDAQAWADKWNERTR